MSTIMNIKSEDIHSFLSLLSSHDLAYEEDITLAEALNKIRATKNGIYIINNWDKDYKLTNAIGYSYHDILETMQIVMQIDLVNGLNIALIIDKNKLYTTEYYTDLLTIFQNITYKLPDFTDYNETMDLLKHCIKLNKNELLDEIKEKTLNELISTINSSGDKLAIDYQKQIDTAYKNLEEAIQHVELMKNLYEEALLLNHNHIINNESIVKDLFNYYNRNKVLQGMTILETESNYTIRMYTSFVKVNYTVGEDTIDAYLDNPQGCLNRLSSELKEIIRDTMKNRERYMLMEAPCYIEIKIPYISLSENKVAWNVVYFSDAYHYENAHHTRYHCTGGFKYDMSEAIRTHNLVQLTALILQYIQTINLDDTAGRTWISNDFQLVYDKQENKYLQLVYPNRIENADNYIKDKLKLINDTIKQGPPARHFKGEIK